jgi:hypothetical protein
LGFAGKVSSIHQAFPKELLIPLRHCSKGLLESLGTFPNVFRNTLGYFLQIP